MPAQHISESELQQIAQENGYEFWCILPDGRSAAVRRGIFNASIIAGLDEFGYDDLWDYFEADEAVSAMNEWQKNGQSEPRGWARHMPSGRRHGLNLSEAR